MLMWDNLWSKMLLPSAQFRVGRAIAVLLLHWVPGRLLTWYSILRV